jgi:hypothetical protein
MTPQEVRDRVDRVRAEKADDERAHGYEDSLWEDVLEAIAAGAKGRSRDLATEALKTKDISFGRWRA